ncbi:hypothetical protein K8R78_08930 [bacterium]|nr:hypothetical protein [bacterium]
MVDKSFIEELKRRNAERAEKLKRDLDMGDLSQLDPGATPKREVFREGVPAAPPPPGATMSAPPPPPSGGGSAPPPPLSGKVSSGKAAPPPPPQGASKSAQPQPPPPTSGAREKPPTPESEGGKASDRFDEPIAPSTGIWDEILGGVTKDAEELEKNRGGAEAFAVPTVDEDAEEPITSGDEPPTGDTSDFIVPKFGSTPETKATTPAPPEPIPVAEPELISSGDDPPTGDTDEFIVPSFASTPAAKETTPTTPEAVPVAEPELISAGEELPTGDIDEFIVPKFGATPDAVEEAPEVPEPVAVEAATDEEFTVPTFDSAPAVEETPAETIETTVPTFDSTPAEEPVLPIAVESEVDVPSFGPDIDEQIVTVPVAEQPAVVEPIEPADFIQPVSSVEPEPTPAPVAATQPTTREPVTAAMEPAEENVHRIVLEVSGAELRLKRLNISLREAANLLEIAAEECRNLLE